MNENGDKEKVRAETSAISRILARLLERFGWRLLLGLVLSAVSLLLLLWLTGEVFEGDVAAFDSEIRTFVHGLANPPLTSAMRTVSVLGSRNVLIALGTLVAILFLYFRCRRDLVVFLVTMAGEIILELTMKAGFMRPRPEPFFPYPPLESYSYPSGHALASFCFYGVLAWIAARRIKSRAVRVSIWSAAALLIAAIGFSRIYLGVHYPSDVFAGYLTACVWTAFVAFVDSAVRRRPADTEP